MLSDKNMGRVKVGAHGKTPLQIQEVVAVQIQIEQASILHIRSISEDLFSLMNQIDNMEPSMRTPTASPVNRKPLSEEEDLIAFSFLKGKVKGEGSQQLEKGKIAKKGSVPAVHYASYMKPTRNMKEKIRQILTNQREQKELERERERLKVEELKQKANKNYSLVESRYHKYDEQKADKSEAIAARLMERELLEMSEVTFKPKTNKNVQVSQSFEERLVSSGQKKQVKEGLIIKDMIKGHTYKPKINSHKASESKIKKIWSESSSPQKERLSKTGFFSFPIEQEHPQHLKASASELAFVIDQALFSK